MATLNRYTSYIRHGGSKHPVYKVWWMTLDRCQNPQHKQWANYGGRGITVCARWQTFAHFWEDMSPTWKRGLLLERRDNEQGYSPANCYWATRMQQNRNTRRNHYIVTPWGRMTLVEAAEKSGIGAATLQHRVTHGWPPDKWFIAPNVMNRLLVGDAK